MLSRTHRFHGYGSLRYAYRNGKVVRGPHCLLKYAPNNRRSTYRVAVVVSKKVHKSAVVRNRIRRRIYEAVRSYIKPDVPIDVIYIVYSDYLANCPADELRQAIVGKLRSARIPQKS
ncbi:MAG TPA: ribonuclease P protein component [Candidatus Saccharimonadales bacterium]|jgi:ribonuclease P protein component